MVAWWVVVKRNKTRGSPFSSNPQIRIFMQSWTLLSHMTSIVTYEVLSALNAAVHMVSVTSGHHGFLVQFGRGGGVN